MKKLTIFFLLFFLGSGVFAANIANPKKQGRKPADEDNITRMAPPRTWDADPRPNARENRKANLFSVSVVGSFYDMVNAMFKTSASIEATWIHDFDHFVFTDLGIVWDIIGPQFNTAAVIFGVGFTPIRYYEPELFIESQFVGGYDFKVGFRNNIKIPGAVKSKIFIDLGITYLSKTTTWTYFLGLGVGLEM